MNNKSGNEQQKNKSMHSFKGLSSVATNISIICSLTGIGLFGAVFFMLANVLDYRSICFMNQCAHYLSFTGVIFFLLSAVLLWFSGENSKQTISFQSHLSGKGLVKRSSTPNISSEDSKQTTKNLKSAKSDKKTKQDTITESTKLSKTSTKNLKLLDSLKQGKVATKILPLPASLKNLSLVCTSKRNDVGAKALPLSTLSKTIQNTSSSKKAEIISKTIFSNTLSKTVKPGAAPQKAENCTRTLLKNISAANKQSSSESKQKGSKIFSTKTSQHSNEKFSSKDKQLVPYKAPLEPLPDKNAPAAQKFPFYQHFTSRQNEIGTRASTLNMSSNALKPNSTLQEAEFSAETSKRSETVLQPIGPPKKRKVSPGTFNPKATENSNEKVPSTTESFAPRDPWNFTSSNENMSIRTNVPFQQNFNLTHATGCTSATANFPSANSQLFPYNPQLFGNPLHEQNTLERPTVPFYQNFMSPYAQRFIPDTEIVTRSIRVLGGGGIVESREHYQMQRRMLYPSLGNGIWSPNFDSPSDQSVRMPLLTPTDSNQSVRMPLLTPTDSNQSVRMPPPTPTDSGQRVRMTPPTSTDSDQSVRMPPPTPKDSDQENFSDVETMFRYMNMD